MSKEELIKEAFKARENAYAPYSGFKVGAAIECFDGSIFYGANIENAAYGASNCGERSAIFACYSRGYRKKDIKALAIVTKAKTVSYSCGICRQVLDELLNPDTPIYLSNGLQTIETNTKDMLPNSFNSEDLK